MPAKVGGGGGLHEGICRGVGETHHHPGHYEQRRQGAGPRIERDRHQKSTVQRCGGSADLAPIACGIHPQKAHTAEQTPDAEGANGNAELRGAAVPHVLHQHGTKYEERPAQDAGGERSQQCPAQAGVAHHIS